MCFAEILFWQYFIFYSSLSFFASLGIQTWISWIRSQHILLCSTFKPTFLRIMIFANIYHLDVFTHWLTKNTKTSYATYIFNHTTLKAINVCVLYVHMYSNYLWRRCGGVLLRRTNFEGCPEKGRRKNGPPLIMWHLLGNRCALFFSLFVLEIKSLQDL